jgi:hypothetical protein
MFRPPWSSGRLPPMTYSPRIGLFLAMLLAGCSSTPLSTASQPGDAAMADAAVADGAPPVITADAAAAHVQPDSALLAPDAGPELAPSECLEAPVPRPGARTTVTLTVDLTYAGKLVPYGEPFPLPTGGTLTISNFRFFLSDVTLLRQGDQPVAVDIVAMDGKPAPFNVHLVNAENPAQMSFRISAPAGDYTGMSFIFGLNDACNARRPGNVPPLNDQSQLSWPSPFGFLFLRYEGVVTGTGKDAPVSALAMGGVIGAYGAPRVDAGGSLQVTSAPRVAHLRVALDEIFHAATLPADLTDKILPPPPAGSPSVPGGDEVEMGEHVRQNATKVPIFSVTSGS